MSNSGADGNFLPANEPQTTRSGKGDARPLGTIVESDHENEDDGKKKLFAINDSANAEDINDK